MTIALEQQYGSGAIGLHKGATKGSSACVLLAGAEEPSLLQVLRYLLLTFRALRRTSGGRRAAAKMSPEVLSPKATQ